MSSTDERGGGKAAARQKLWDQICLEMAADDLIQAKYLMAGSFLMRDAGLLGPIADGEYARVTWEDFEQWLIRQDAKGLRRLRALMRRMQMDGSPVN